MNRTYLYLVTRGDLSKDQQVVQLMHAAVEHAYQKGRPVDNHPSFVVLVAKNKKELLELNERLYKAGLKTTEFHEPHNNWGLTAVSCSVLQEQRFLFADLPLWSLSTTTKVST